MRDPGPKTSVAGKVITGADGEPIPDRAVVDAARNTILKTIRTRMDLLGLAAPRKSMNLQMTAELDSENEQLQAQVAEAYQAALEERDRELADLRAQLARASGCRAWVRPEGKAGRAGGRVPAGPRPGSGPRLAWSGD